MASPVPYEKILKAFLLVLSGLLLLSCGSGVGANASDMEPPPRRGILLFRWEGWIDGMDILKFRNKSWWAEHVESAPITGASCHFFAPLGPECFPVEVVREQGRCRVGVIRQGDDWNGQTLMISLDDRELPGRSYVRLAVYAASKEAREEALGQPALSVRLEVDDEAVVGVSPRGVRLLRASGHGVRGLHYCLGPRGFDPSGVYRIHLIQGRGDLSLLEPGAAMPPPPGLFAGLRLKFRPDKRDPLKPEADERLLQISDPASGMGIYEFELFPANP